MPAATELSYILTEWSLALDRVACDREVNDPRSGRTRRTPREFVRPSSCFSFLLESRHHAVWQNMVIRLHDPTRTPASTWVSREALAQMSGLISSQVDEVFEDLIELRMLAKKKRGRNHTNELKLFLTPYEEGQEDKTPSQFVRLPGGKPGYFGEKAEQEGAVEDTPIIPTETTKALVQVLVDTFPDHKSLSALPPVRQKLLRKLIAGMQFTHSPDGAFNVICEIAQAQTPKAARIRESIRASRDMGAYISKSFPGWWDDPELNYPDEASEATTYPTPIDDNIPEPADL